jgi:WD40 repeat protein
MQSSTAYLFNTRDASLIARLEGHESGLVYLAFSPNGRYLATGSLDRTARLWDATNGSLWLTCRGHNGFVTSVEFSPDSRHLITASADGTARLWPVNPQNAAERQRPRELTGAERERFGLDPEVP